MLDLFEIRKELFDSWVVSITKIIGIKYFIFDYLLFLAINSLKFCKQYLISFLIS